MLTPLPSNYRRTKSPAPIAALIGLAALGSLAVVAAVTIGCEAKPSGPPAPPEPARPEAEVKFEHIYEDINRLVGTTDSTQARDTGATGEANTEWSHTVEKELIPPDGEHENYRGKITITVRYTVTMFTYNRSKKDESGDKKNQDRSQGGDEFADETDPLAEFELPAADRASPLSNHSPMKTRDGEDVKVYDLEFIDGSWELLTDPDPETEMAIKAAFEYALRRQ